RSSPYRSRSRHATPPAPLSCPTRRSSDLLTCTSAPRRSTLRRSWLRSPRTEEDNEQPTGPVGVHGEAVYAEQARTDRAVRTRRRSEEHTSELQSRENLVCRLLLEKKTRQN